MAGLFKRVYDWLLRLFWSVFDVVPWTFCVPDLQTLPIEFSFCGGDMMLTRVS
jgi:hypothetical protein